MTTILRTSLLLAAATLSSCGGGGSDSAAGATSGDLDLEVCSLGCSGGTCSVRQIAVNSDLVFNFDGQIDPNTVSFTSISLVNLTNGGTPTGKFLVNGSEVIFRPSYLDGQEGVSFGFEESSIYSLELKSEPGESFVVRTTTGRGNKTQLNCTFEATGIRDYVPGAPVVTVTPNEAEPPTSRAFQIVLEFNDLVRSSQLLNPDGSSPTITVNLVSVDNMGVESVSVLDGTFEFRSDVDARTSTFTFQPFGELPTGRNGTRWVRVDVANQVADLVGNRVVNAGEFIVPLPNTSGETGAVTETFATTAFLDELSSAPQIWEGTGFLDSSLNPATGVHAGGGSGLFGSPDLDGFVFDTGTTGTPGSVYSELLDTHVEVDDGVIMLSGLDLGLGDTASATGTNPLRLYVRGSADLRGRLDLSGQDGETNFGFYRPFDERLSYSALNPSDPPPAPDSAMQALMEDLLEASGGAGGAAALAGGRGGDGGVSWHTFPGFYNDAKEGWNAQHTGFGSADESRYVYGIGNELVVAVHGNNGGRVGGDDAAGAPLPGAAANQIPLDVLAGSGQGSLAWPPKSGFIPTPASASNRSWPNDLSGTEISGYQYNKIGANNFFRWFSIVRSRGGGGGGYWTDGTRGDFHDGSITAVDSYGDSLLDNEPLFSYYNTILATNHNFNGSPGFSGNVRDDADREAWPDYIQWDSQGANLVPDATGGQFTPTVGGNPEAFYTLSPTDGFLRGGAGGGGAGMSQHGSFNFELASAAQSVGQTESFRDGDGAGGGAGGGAVQIQVARDFTLTGTIDLSGGDGGSSASRVGGFEVDTAAFLATRAGDAGGGGGAGGALLLQVAGTPSFFAGSSIDLSGGTGGLGAVGNDGGDGGAGVFRFESDTAFTLADANGVVSPIDSYDLGTRPEYGLTGENQGPFSFDLSGSVGDFTVQKAVGTGNVFFNGNSTGIASTWYEGDPAKLFLTFQDWTIEVEWSNGTGAPQTITYNDANPTAPGSTPIWAAFQTGYGFADGGVVELQEGTEGPWIVPGYNTQAGGNLELTLSPALTRLIRYQIVFDQDLVTNLIGTNPNAYFRVTSVAFGWGE